MPDPYKILIADDLEETLGTLREWLSSKDYHVRCARDGREALEIARSDPPDLILLDKVMPEIDGLAVARQLKREERFSTVPIIMLTGRDDTRRHAIFDAGDADDLIMKPLDYNEVETRVRTMLRKRDVFRQLERANEELRLANERMSRLVQYDEKTHLHNYRHFTQRLQEEFKRVKRYGPNLTLVMFDLDHFKSVNDRFGHLAGDQVLVSFGRIMSRSARETDIIARYGGEEFTILLPHTSASQGKRLAERVRRSTESFDFPEASGDGPVSITVSAGVATFPINDRIQEAEHLVAAADNALYRAKAAGRNRTHVDERSLANLI